MRLIQHHTFRIILINPIGTAQNGMTAAVRASRCLTLYSLSFLFHIYKTSSFGQIKKCRKVTTLQKTDWAYTQPDSIVSNLPAFHIQLACTIMDRYNNAKSVTIPLPTRVRQTTGALLSDRKPGCKPLPHLHCSTCFLHSQHITEWFRKVLLFAQFAVSHTHFTLKIRHFHHQRCCWIVHDASEQG